MIDKASLIQIPSGYKNGKLYSVKPTPTYGSELVTNGDFATDSDWNKGANWTISGGKAVGINTFTSLSQSISLLAQSTYKITFTILDYVSGDIKMQFTGGTTVNSDIYNSNGTYIVYLVALSGNNTFNIKGQFGAEFNGSIDNVSVKEVTNSGDFDFSRSSSGTRVNSEGLIETAQVVSTTEEVTNGDFASSSNWNGVNANGVTISNGTLNYSETPNGTNITQSSVVEIGKRYKVTFTISNYVKGGILVVLGAGGTTQEVSSNGTFNLYGVASINTTLYIQARGASGTTLSIDNVSVKEVIENDVPRLDYSDGSCASLLLEPQSTNLVTQSEDMSSSIYIKSNVTFTGQTTTAPDGSQAEFLTVNSYIFLNAYAIGGASSSTIRTFSFYVKAQSEGYQISYRAPNSVVTTINVSSTEWTRVVATGTNSENNIMLQDNRTLSSVGNVAFWGVQLENQSYATSYIPSNSGSSTTRTADVCNNAGTSATFSDSEGVLFAEIATLVENTGLGTNNKEISISDGTQNNRVSISLDTRYNRVGFLFSNNGSSVTKYYTVGDAIKNYNKYALRYKNGELVGYFNGVEVVSDFTITTPIANNLSKLAFLEGRQTKHFYGKCKQLIVFNEALSDSELQTLTS